VNLKADGLLILTDVGAVATDFGTNHQKFIKSVTPERLFTLMDHFPAGSMGPKVESAMEFVHLTSGWCAIGNLKEADKILAGEAGTMVRNNADPNHIEYYEPEAKRLESGNTAAT
jgi:carbamate kinase